MINPTGFDYAQYVLALNSYNQVIETQGLTFPAKAYSGMKFGQISGSRLLGEQLAESFFSTHFEWLSTFHGYDELAVSALPFKELTTGAGQIAEHFILMLNRLLDMQGIAPAVLLPFYKFEAATGYGNAYPSMTEEERVEVLKSLSFNTNEHRLKKVTKLIMIDDILVTGANARKSAKVLVDSNFLGDVKFIFVAKVEDQTALESPHIESIVNGFWIDNVGKILELYSNGSDFQWNVRTLKFIFELPESDFEHLMKGLNGVLTQNYKDFILDLYDWGLRMNICGDDRYLPNFKNLRKVCNSLLY
jgi:hypothetical protein